MRRAVLIWTFLLSLALPAALHTEFAAQAQKISDASPATNADDAEQWFAVAKAASEAGDVPKAIAALERVLQNNPGLSNIRLELGLLYLRAGNADLARTYLKQSVNAPDAPEGARVRARQALRSARRRFSVSGTVLVGAQYQSNPNGSPDTVSVAGFDGAPILVTGSELTIPRGGDVSGSASASVELRYDLAGQLDDAIVLDATAAVNRYAKQSAINAGYFNLQLGPRLFLGAADAPDSFVRPFVSATLLTLGGPRYFSAFGGGANLYLRLAAALHLSLAAGYERRDYHNSSARPVADEQTGDYYSAGADLIWQAGPRVRVTGGVSSEHVDARMPYWSRDSYGVQAGVARALSVRRGGSVWLARLGAAYQRNDYDQPDPLIDAFRRRHEKRAEMSASLEVPVRTAVAVDLRVQQTWNLANLPNYDFTNSLGALSLSYRF